MKKLWIVRLSSGLILAVFLGLTFIQPVQAQLPTGSVPTVTGTPSGPYITVNSDQDPGVNLRALPNTLSTKVGILLPGQQATAIGKLGNWILILYPGIPGGQAWVSGSLVKLTGGDLPDVEPPPTMTPLYTDTIDPTLAAQFIVTIGPTRQPTLTAPPPLRISTFPPQVTEQTSTRNIPIGLVITGLGLLGIFLGLISLIRGR